MFRCSEVAERASLLIDGELGLWPRLNIRLHLAMCRGCRAFVEQMRITRDLAVLAGAAEDPLPSAEIQAALAKRRIQSGRPS
ncbi:putative transmembrane anti-sigma factor [Agrobacterium albertimagni AOL15]|uniref:Putative transmembrane anti-sigma factor n=1 Tax=Agrobacterium albertimagni AOL15 TaxID=1156935 RepID=K2Q6Z5_9HYPH|nr:zf-HC2 domain-containing protein [Agrobacterium albertimagni]EKF61015.1 putative transmembrane anti-sigma factor [Agrobacterium albertimagni AOL15]